MVEGIKGMRNSSGLTLAELLLAAAIMAFAVCGLIALFVNCSFLNETNRNSTLGKMHAQYVLEEIRNANFTGVESAITSGNWDWAEADILARSLVPLLNESIDTGVFQSGNPLGVSVRVDWQDRRGRARQTQLQTLITDY
ncbi:hypothetical protein ACFL1D_04245 [Candidatus Omnitrophota bacterium]